LKDYRAYLQEKNISRAVHLQGLKVLVEEHPSGELAALRTWVLPPEGSADSTTVQVLMEALAADLDQAVRPLGGLVDVDTESQPPSFLTTVPVVELGDAIRAQLGLLTLQAGGFGSERWKVSSRQREHQDFRAFLQQQAEASLGLNPAPVEPAAEVTDSRIRELHARLFRLDRMNLLVSGTVRQEEVLKIVGDEIRNLPESQRRAASKDLPQPPVRASSSPPTAVAASGGGTESGNETASYRSVRWSRPFAAALVSFRLPEVSPNDLQALDLARYLLSEGYGALLEFPREKEPVAPAEVVSWMTGGERAKQLSFVLFTEPGTLEKSEARLLGTLQAMSEAALPVVLVNRAKALLLTDFLAGTETLAGRTRSLARFESAGDFRNRDLLPGRIAAISEADIRKAVGRFLHRKSASVIEFLPESAEARLFTPDSFSGMLDVLVPAAALQEKAFLELFRTREDPPPFRMPAFSPSVASTELRKSSILRGPEIYLRERHLSPLAHFGFYFGGGRIEEAPETAGITRLMVESLLQSRTRGNGGLDLALFEAMGVRLAPLVDEDFFGVNLTCLSGGSDTAFFGVVELIQAGLTLSPDDVAAARRRIEVQDALACSPRSRLIDEGRAALFPDHPYGRAFSPCMAAAAGTPDQVIAWRDRHSAQTFPTIVVTGDVSGTSFLEGLISRLSNSKFSQTQPVQVKYKSPGRRFPKVRDQERLMVVAEGPRLGQDYVEMLSVARALLGGRGGKLGRLVRETGKAGFEGFAMENDLLAGALDIELVGEPDSLDGVAEAVLAAIRETAEANTSPQEFRSAQVRTITELLSRQADPQRFLKATMKAALAGEPSDYGARFILNVRNMRMGEVELGITRFLGARE